MYPGITKILISNIGTWIINYPETKKDTVRYNKMKSSFINLTKTHRQVKTVYLVSRNFDLRCTNYMKGKYGWVG